MPVVTHSAAAAEMIAAVRDCFPADSIANVTEDIIDLQLDPYGERIVKVEAGFGIATISLIHPEKGTEAWTSHPYRDGGTDGLTDAVFAFIKAAFNLGGI
ncbi:hypothetical protein ACFV4P_03085 [Kitasatospora sp. NPDC059795]|uniref:hypothetical protein n=1 Tax=Kitasatospora sp. NPDC059795 TaxID=3346949 RepID=UPI003661B5DF